MAHANSTPIDADSPSTYAYLVFPAARQVIHAFAPGVQIDLDFRNALRNAVFVAVREGRKPALARWLPTMTAALESAGVPTAKLVASAAANAALDAAFQRRIPEPKDEPPKPVRSQRGRLYVNWNRGIR